MKKDPPEDWLLLEEVARITRAPLSSVRFWCSKGKLESIKPGRRRMVHREALKRFLAVPLPTDDQPVLGPSPAKPADPRH